MATIHLLKFGFSIIGTWTIGSFFNGIHGSFLLLLNLALGSFFLTFLFLLDYFLKTTHIRSFNALILGLFFGTLMSKSLLFFIDIAHFPISLQTLEILKSGITLIVTYASITLTLQMKDSWAATIPFIFFKPVLEKKKDLLLDESSLLDPGILDLAASGLLDHHLIFPRYLVNDFIKMLEEGEPHEKLRGKRLLETLKKLEEIPSLGLRFIEIDLHTKEPPEHLIHLAAFLETNILTADPQKIHPSTVDGVRFIHLNTLSNALKPLTQNGEYLTIKIQRYGKEVKQGVGYLEDGTMVVVNGGADFIGETIKTQVLSLKHTSSGRMIFCNTLEEKEISSSEESVASSAEKYFAL